MADIWYATSRDGFRWKEQGPAVRRGAAGAFDDRAVFTPDILALDGKYYSVLSGDTGRVETSVDPPDRHGLGGLARRPLDQAGPSPSCGRAAAETLSARIDDADAIASFGEWDSHKLHDPYVLVYRGQIWLYYKGVQFGRTYRHDLGRRLGRSGPRMTRAGPS